MDSRELHTKNMRKESIFKNVFGYSEKLCEGTLPIFTPISHIFISLLSYYKIKKKDIKKSWIQTKLIKKENVFLIKVPFGKTSEFVFKHIRYATKNNIGVFIGICACKKFQVGQIFVHGNILKKLEKKEIFPLKDISITTIPDPFLSLSMLRENSKNICVDMEYNIFQKYFKRGVGIFIISENLSSICKVRSKKFFKKNEKRFIEIFAKLVKLFQN